MPVLRPLARIWTALLTLAALTLALGLVARWLLPAAPWVEAPTLAVSSPVDGAVDVLPRSEVALSFSAPMNRVSTLAALRITPPTPGSFRWSDDARQISFIPEATLKPASDYMISIGGDALGKWWRPIAAPRQIRFRTAPLPAVVAALPSSSDAPLDGMIAIIFSQAMVSADKVGLPVVLPQLRIEPPVSTQLRWLDQTTLLIRSDAPLRAATSYTATIAPDLTDLRGVDLGRSFTWSWSTAWPEPLEHAPAAGARWVSPHQPLALTLAAPLDQSMLRATLKIDPPVEGEIASAAIGTTQVVTFTPRLGWEYGRSYRVSLASDNPALAAPPDLAWRFSVEPQPSLIAFFPGQGQALPAGQEVRLIFSTPMDEGSLRAGLRIDPPVSSLPLQVNETEVRLRPNLRPSTTYTLTVDASTRDRSGEPLGITATVRLTSASAEPSLRAPDATANVISLPISRTAQIALERINLSRLDLSLYQLDQATVVRAMGLKPDEWHDFSPERYGQALARSWQLPLSDPANTPARDPITVTLADGAPLAPGIYYLRVTSQEGPRADLLLAVSSVALTLRQSDSQVLVWATDSASGQPLAGVPLALYAGETLITRGQTDGDGVWQQPIQRPPRGAPYLALAEGRAPTIVRGDWLATPSRVDAPRSRSLIFLDRLVYRPGDRVQIGGVVRLLADSDITLPAAGTPCRMQLVSDDPAAPAPSATCLVLPTGTVSGTLRLSSSQPPGNYRLFVSVGDSTAALRLHVSAEAMPIELSLSPGASGQVLIRASQTGLPLVGAAISWTLSLEPLALPADHDGFYFSANLPAPSQISGSGTTDTGGRIIVPPPARAAPEAPLRYLLRAELSTPSEPAASGQITGIIQPINDRVGLRLPGRIVLSDERATVELLALAADGAPAPGRQISVAVYRRGDTDGPPIIARSATSDALGRADVQLVQLRPGAYEIAASLGDSSSSVGLWVVGGRYTGWQGGNGQVEVVPDRDSYRPGDVAHLLVTAPYTQSNLLLTTERGTLRSVELRDLRASQLITVAITPDMAPGISIGAVVAAGAERLVGNAFIRVTDGQPALAVSVAADSRQYAPASTAVLSVTSSLAGAPAASDMLVSVAPADSPDDTLALAQLTPPPPPPETAMLLPSPAAATNLPVTDGALTGGEGYLVPIGAGVGGAGQLVLRVPLPDANGRWRISAYAAAGADQFAVGSTIVTTSVPLELTPTAPPSLRPGDRAEASLLVRNTSPVTQALRVRLQATGGDIGPATPSDRQLLLAPGGAQRLVWMISSRLGSSTVALRYTVSGDNLSEQVARDLPVLPVAPTTTQRATLVATGDLTATLPLADPTEGDLSLAVAPGVGATLADSAAALASAPERSVEQQAGLLLISAALARSAPPAGSEQWTALARRAAAELEEAQNPDGGWGWWPEMPSRPFVSAFAVEAQLVAHESVTGIAAPGARALAYLSRAGAELDPDAQAYLLYVRARAGVGDPAAALALAKANLAADGLAYVSQALPADAAAGAIERLIAAALPAIAGGEEAQLTWAAAAPSAIPRSQAAVIAAAAQALRAGRPQATERAAAERGLLTRWGVDGWPGPFAAARVAVALPVLDTRGGGPRSVQLGRATLIDRAEPITSTLRLQTPAASARGAVLRVRAAGQGSYLVASQAAGQLAEAGAELAQISLYQEYLDPLTGAVINPATLRVGQIIALRVTMISARPLMRGSLEIALPSALQPITLGLRTPFVHAAPITPSTRSLRVEAVEIAPGVYTLRVTARVAGMGEFEAPGARLILDEDGLPPVVAPPSPPLIIGD